MPNEFAARVEHSAEYFGEARDFWWNDDFLALALRRWGVTGVSSVLDVGCGIGHWTRAWARVLPAGVRFTGIDREPRWVEKALELSLREPKATAFGFRVGNAEQLPFPDNSFDFVTCQTLLIHVQDPRAVLAEMVRVTIPGGLVVVAEPNNAMAPFLEDAQAVALSIEETAALLQFYLTCLRGKRVLGCGDESIGRVLAQELQQSGLENISISINEKACPLVPPYTSRRERALCEEISDWAQRDFWIWSRGDAECYFAAGGGAGDSFAPAWDLACQLGQKVCDHIQSGKYTCAGGAWFYLAAGRKAGSAG